MLRSARLFIATLAAAAVALAVVPAALAGTGQSDLAAVRRATAAFHDPSAAEAAGYGPFYVCTDEPGQGAMGQHFVDLAAVLDPSIDPLHPEALAYAPTADGGYRLVAVEYLVFAADWDATHAAPPELFGQQFGLVDSPNRYGLPAFYELHVWLWQANPSGMFNEWNPLVTCSA